MSGAKPKRIQRRRTKGWRMPEGAVYVGRPSRWGNPWTPDNTIHVVMSPKLAQAVESSRPCTVAECVEAYRESIAQEQFGYGRDEIRAELASKDLVCWCPLDAPCHADVLLEIANA